MKLSNLFDVNEEFDVKGISIDSRKMKADYLFFCIVGVETDGHKYVDSAIDNGAKVIVHEKPLDNKREGIIYIKVDSTQAELNRVCNIFYGQPSHKLTMFGVTGTNGKSTITNIIEQIYSQVKPCGYIGTISIEIGDKVKAPDLTTPDAVTMHENLSEMVKMGMEAAAIEVSAHGLSLHRVDSVDFDYAIYTNLTHDHLDFYHTMENYLEAKTILFRNLKPTALAVINKDDIGYKRIAETCACPYVTYGIEEDSDYMAKDIVFERKSTTFTLVHGNEEYTFKTNLAAKYNVYNLLASIAVLTEAGVPMDIIIDQSKNIKQIAGRMEVIDEGQDFDIIVDYAHTPDGFEKILHYTKVSRNAGRIIGVFGASGKRDKSKRRVLGEVAAKYCDYIILTEENKRDETPKGIAEMIAEGIKDTEYEFIEKREDAIEEAIRIAKPNDCIAILGKGDEAFLYDANGRVPWKGDNNIARDAVKKYVKEKQ